MSGYGWRARLGTVALGCLVALGAQPVLDAAAAAPAAPSAPAYYPSGPQFDVPVATVTAGGWTPCYTDTYDTDLHAALPGLLEACDGDYLMLAGRTKDSQTLSLLAAAPRADVLHDTGTSETATHESNGSAWYFSDEWSWGFANAGDSVRRFNCDVLQGPQRLCWHTNSLAGGYRIGDNTGLNGSSEYERVVYQYDRSQTITFTSPAPADAVPGDSYEVSATGGRSGNPVTFSIDASSSAVCSVEGSTVTLEHAGDCVVNADQAGDDDYDAATQAQQTITVGKAPQTVAFTSTPPADAVVGQRVAVAATGGASGSPVTFSLAPESADACTLDGARVTLTHPGTCVVLADQSGGADWSDAPSVTQAIAVSQARTTTGVSVERGRVVADVAVTAPGAGRPSGTVTFSVGGRDVGTAPVTHGVATLSHQVPTGAARTVAARYSGDRDFAGSSESTSRKDPRITARVTSGKARSRHGWYRSPVTVRFTCITQGAALTRPCPAPVTLKASRGGQSVTRTITARDGGTATVSVSGLDVDRRKPQVRIAGVRNGAVVTGDLPQARCVARDRLSGVASCRLVRRESAGRTVWTAVATDRAGNVRRARAAVTALPIYLDGAPFRNGAFSVQVGRTYQLVVTDSATRPVYYNAAVHPQRPTGRGPAFHAAGHHRWTMGVTMDAGLRGARLWNLGVKIGGTMHHVKVRVG